MKNSMYKCCKVVVFVLLLLLSACHSGNIVTRTFPEENILTVAQLQALPERTNPNQYAVMLEKDEAIPVLLKLESDIASFAQDRIELRLKERLYFRLQVPEHITEKDWQRLEDIKEKGFSQMEKAAITEFLKHYMLFISRDSVHWAPISNIKACKEVVGIKGGEFSLGLMASAESGVQANVTVTTHSTDSK